MVTVAAGPPGAAVVASSGVVANSAVVASSAVVAVVVFVAVVAEVAEVAVAAAPASPWTTHSARRTLLLDTIPVMEATPPQVAAIRLPRTMRHQTPARQERRPPQALALLPRVLLTLYPLLATGSRLLPLLVRLAVPRARLLPRRCLVVPRLLRVPRTTLLTRTPSLNFTPDTPRRPSLPRTPARPALMGTPLPGSTATPSRRRRT